MILSAKKWFEGLSQREKILITIMAVLSIIVIGYYGIFRPANGIIDNAKERHDVAIKNHANIASKVEILRNAKNNNASDTNDIINVPLDIYLAQSAAEIGLTLEKNTEMGSNRADIIIGSARPKILFSWLSMLESKGLEVTEMTVSAIENEAVSLKATMVKSEPS